MKSAHPHLFDILKSNGTRIHDDHAQQNSIQAYMAVLEQTVRTVLEENPA